MSKGRVFFKLFLHGLKRAFQFSAKLLILSTNAFSGLGLVISGLGSACFFFAGLAFKNCFRTLKDDAITAMEAKYPKR